MRIDQSLLTLLFLLLLGVPACDGDAPSKYSDEALEELAAIDFGSSDPDPNDDRAMTQAQRELWAAKHDFANWAKTNGKNGSVWGSACETDCWADWWLCVDSCTGDDGIHPLSLDLNGGFNHTNDQCWNYCDMVHDRCLMSCLRARGTLR